MTVNRRDEDASRDAELEQKLTDDEKRRLDSAVAKAGTAEQAGGESLAATLSRRYLSMGRQALADSQPTRLDSETRSSLNRVLGVDAADVRIHTGTAAQAAADAFDARAFTMGSRDVYFAKDQYAPGTAEGQALLAHELTHVYEDNMPIALSTFDDQQRGGPSRDGEEHAHTNEEAMYREAMRDKWLEDQEEELAYAELSAGEKIVLTDKVYKILRQRAGDRQERSGR